jgi:hypothetical protein
MEAIGAVEKRNDVTSGRGRDFRCGSGVVSSRGREGCISLHPSLRLSTVSVLFVFAGDFLSFLV